MRGICHRNIQFTNEKYKRLLLEAGNKKQNINCNMEFQLFTH